MNCWQTLEINADADKKTIKLAYAKQLKKTRPDDDPEGFMALQKAYKVALMSFKLNQRGSSFNSQENQENSAASTSSDIEDHKIAAAAQNETHQPLVVSTIASTNIDFAESNDSDHAERVIAIVSAPDDSKTNWSETLAKTPVEVFDYQKPNYLEALETDRELIETRAYQLIGSPNRVNKIEEWTYIETVTSMIDLNFSSQIGDLIFDIVSKANASTLKNNKAYVEPPVLRYLNDYFQWEKSWRRYERTHGRKQTHAVFMFTGTDKDTSLKKSVFMYIGTDKDTSVKRETHSARRALAFGIDMLIVIAPISYSLPSIHLAYIAITVSVLYALAGIPIMEASPLQASTGKWILKLQVVDKQGDRLHQSRSWSRCYLTYLSLLLSQFFIFANAFTYYKYRTLVHDELTHSYVVKRSL